MDVTAKLDKHLVDNWRELPKMLSVRVTALVGVLLTVQQVQPQFEAMAMFAPIVQHPYYKMATALLAFGVIVARAMRQNNVSDATPAP